MISCPQSGKKMGAFVHGVWGFAMRQRRPRAEAVGSEIISTPVGRLYAASTAAIVP